MLCNLTFIWISRSVYYCNYYVDINSDVIYELVYFFIISYEPFNSIFMGFVKLFQGIIIVEKGCNKQVSYIFLTKFVVLVLCSHDYFSSFFIVIIIIIILSISCK